MKCSKCGAEILSGNLYCTECGEEIHMVPVFEPEVEIKLDETMNRIVDDVAEGPMRTAKKQRVISKKSRYLTAMIILIVLGIVVCIFSLQYLFNSVEYHVNRGNQLADNSEYVEAIEYYERALEIDDSNYEVLVYLARCYDILQDEERFETYLLRIISHPLSAEENILTAYDKLISLYIEKNSYQMIDSLLKDCNNGNVVALYGKYMVSDPEFSYEAGYYKEIIPLKITAGENETIYYTMDGSEPTVESEVFNMPIFMDDGEYEIKAICVNQYGVVSKVVTKEYQIDL